MAPPPLAEVEAAVAAFYRRLDRLDADAWRRVAAVFADAQKRAAAALERAAAAAAANPGDAGAAFVAARARFLVAELDAAYADAAAKAAPIIAEATTAAATLGAASTSAIGGVYGAAWVDVNANAVAALAAVSQPGRPVYALLAQLGRDAAEAAVRELAAGAALGYNPRKTARLMVKAADGLASARARTIARTETLRAFRSAHLAAYRQNADVVGGWMWRAKLDTRTCPACWALHGSIHPVDEDFAAHPNCRCRPIPVPDLPDAALDAYTRSVGTGPDRFAALSAGEQRAILGPARYDLYAAGRLRLEDVVGYATHPVWGRSARVRAVAQTPTRRRVRARR